MGNIKEHVIYVIAILMIGCLGYHIYIITERNNQRLEEIHMKNLTERTYEVQFYDQTIKSLKKENEALYDSIKMYKDELDYALQFKYEKEYSSDTVYIEKTVTIPSETPKVFEYSNNSDSLRYKLQISSLIEPEWYKIDFKVSDQFTILNNRTDEGLNETIIKTNTNADISDVTVWKKDRSSFWDHFSVGPTVAAGYDFINNKPAVVVGVGVTVKIGKNNKK